MNQLTRRRFLQMLTTATASSAFSIFCNHKSTEQHPTSKPNIIFILSDDQGWAQLGCYGSKFYETPHIDRLASQGMRFTNAYAAAPVCSPTRASFLTGKYPARLYLTDFIKGGKPPANSPLKHPKWQKYLPLEEITIAEVLKKAGYATASFGKWHLSQEKLPPKSLPYNPDKQGFDESFVTYKPVASMAQKWQTPENDAHNVKIIMQKSLEFMEKHQQQPFFLYLAHNTIHNPLKEKKVLIEKYKQKTGADLPENNPIIGAMLETLDNSIGQILQKLDQLNLAENTVVVFFSDNGGLEKEADQSPLRNGKASLYEGGIRVPLIVRWTGKVKPGAINDELVSSIDFFVTFSEIAESTQTVKNIDGISLLPALTQTGKLSRQAIFWHYPHYHSAGEGPAGAIRQGDYKLIEWYENSLLGLKNQIELYNLKTDIGETQNLVHEMPEKAEELWKRLKSWRKSVMAQMPIVADRAN